MNLKKDEIKEMRQIKAIIGRNIHILRLKRKFTLKKLSRLSGISADKIDYFEMGKNNIDILSIVKISNILKIE